MAEIKWIKLSVNMFDDEKIKLIRTMPEGDSIALIWVQILCLAGKINDGGLVYMGQNLAYSDEMLATILGHPVSTMRIALSALDQFEMIDVTGDGTIDVLKWGKHQSTDKMAQIKEQNRIRQQRYYYRDKLRELGYAEKDIPDDIDALKALSEKPNVSLTLANATEVRSKKIEVRSKKLDKDNTPDKPTDSELVSDFDKLWSLYPKKERKQEALKAYKKAIKDGTTNKEIQSGIVAYKEKLEAEGTDYQFIAQGGTWFNQQRWNDEYVIAPVKKKTYGKQKYEKPTPVWMDQQTKTQPLQQSEPTQQETVSDEELKANEAALRAKMANLFGGDGDR